MTVKRRPKPLTRLCLGAMALLCATLGQAAEDRYRVEVIVFQNTGADAVPAEVETVRPFHDLFQLDEEAQPEAPVLLDKQDGAFGNIWTRLERLEAYQPLARLTFEQTLFDYHPPVRLHNDEVIAEELHFPGDVLYLDLLQDDPNAGLFDPWVAPLYRLDGSIQLRRSRFLHIDLDLEYRLDSPAWADAYPPLFEDQGPFALEPGFELIGAPPAPAPQPTPLEADALFGGLALEEETPDPFQLHRLQQSRQIRSNTMQYFDSAYLGAIVRVTPISDASE